MLSITDGERAEDFGMNMRLAYTVKHIQKGLTLFDEVGEVGGDAAAVRTVHGIGYSYA